MGEERGRFSFVESADGCARLRARHIEKENDILFPPAEKELSASRTESPLRDGYRPFYEDYLGLSIPEDGEVVESSPCRLVMRRRNECPTLDACLRFGLDTAAVCRGADVRKSMRRCARLLY